MRQFPYFGLVGVAFYCIFYCNAFPQWYIFRRQVPPLQLPGFPQFQQLDFPQELLQPSTTQAPSTTVAQQSPQLNSQQLGTPNPNSVETLNNQQFQVGIQETSTQQPNTPQLGFDPFLQPNIMPLGREPNIEQNQGFNPFQQPSSQQFQGPISNQESNSQEPQQSIPQETHSQQLGFNPFQTSNSQQPHNPIVQHGQPIQAPAGSTQTLQSNNNQQFHLPRPGLFPELHLQQLDLQPGVSETNFQPNQLPTNNTAIAFELPLVRAKPVPCREREHWTARCRNDCECSSGRFCTEHRFCHFGRQV